MEKTIIAKQVLEKLKTDLMRTIKQRDEAQQEANSHVGAMESRYDTFKEENGNSRSGNIDNRDKK